MYIVQIKGTNGSGKTSIPKGIMELSGDCDVIFTDTGEMKYHLTIMRDLQWIAIGKYELDKPMGGCDKIHNIASIKAAILDAYLEHPSYYGIVFEGMMISTIKSTFYDYLLDMETEYGIIPRFIILKTTGEKCVERILGRGTSKMANRVMTKAQLAEYKYDIQEKENRVLRNAGEYDQQYVRYLDVDRVGKDRMVKTFFTLVPDVELASQL